MTICRFCRTDIDGKARRCPHCHADLSLFGRLRPIISIAAAIGGMGFGLYEQDKAIHSHAELQQEHAALTKVLDSVPEKDIPEKYKNGKSESACAAEVKRNPGNIDARIRLRWLQRRKSKTGKIKTGIAARPPVRAALNPRGGPQRKRNDGPKTRR